MTTGTEMAPETDPTRSEYVARVEARLASLEDRVAAGTAAEGTAEGNGRGQAPAPEPDYLARVEARLASLETRLAASTALAPGAAKTGAEAPATPRAEGKTASADAEYWAAAVQVGLALSQASGLTGVQTAIAALLPTAVQAVDNSSAGNPLLKDALVPAGLSGAAYYIGRQVIR